MATKLIKLNRNIAGHKKGDEIAASDEAIKSHKLKAPDDYTPRGTFAIARESDLKPLPEAASTSDKAAPSDGAGKGGM